MTNDDYFASPNRKPKPPKPSEPGELLFEFRVGAKRYRVELRFHGKSRGWEAQYFVDEEFCFSHRFLLRTHAIKWAERERTRLESGNPSEPFWED